MITYLPRRSTYDPPEVSEGSLDPLGLALLAGRLAEQLVPGMTERTRRPRFLTALAVGAAVLQRGGQAVYRDTRQGQAQIAWERLLGEAYAWKGLEEDRGLLGVPGSQKARDARDANVRLLSHLYLKAPGAVGLWVAYKGLAVATGILDEEGSLLEAGYELLEAWERGVGEKGAITGAGSGADGEWAKQFDEALGPLMGEAEPKWKPQRAWELLHAHLHPSRMTDPERAVLFRLLRESNAQRGAMFEYVEARWRKAADLLELPERRVLEAIPALRASLREAAQTSILYEALAGQLMAAFECLLSAASRLPDGRVDAGRVLKDDVVGATFASAPSRIRAAVTSARPAVEAAVDPALARATLDWVDARLVDTPEALFEGLIQRHHETQRRKPPDGKLPWIEGEPGSWFVRASYLLEEPPPSEGYDWVHPYRTYAVRSCLWDLWGQDR